MIDQTTITWVILGMAVVTYGPRFLPAWLLSQRKAPPWLALWLRHVPPAVLAAMLLPELIIREGKVHLGPTNLFLLAAIPTLAVAIKTRSLVGSVLVGMGLVAAARFLGWS